MPSALSRQRDLDRERRRRRRRRQRQATALGVVLLLAALLGLGLFLLSGGDSSSPVQARDAETSTGKKVVAKTSAGTVPLVTALAKLIDETAHLGERAALDRFAAQGQPLYCGGSSGRFVALTFDDGPESYTRLALKILRKKHVRATFFLIGHRVPSRQSQVREELRDYSALGVHAWTHRSLTRLGRARISHQITWTNKAISKATGTEVRLFRPPYGARNARVDRIARRLGMIEVLWSIDSGDSQGNNWRQIGREVLRNIRPGSIVLLHENRGQTIRALHRLILPGLEKRGLTPVTVPELLMLDPPPLDGSSNRCWVHWRPY
jgi:peptidoglycan/xylan/chitin deacetylase (PgdA/CDA1 family)